jgi:3',5'-cyclic AMP phosphodiesterase CpdA
MSQILNILHLSDVHYSKKRQDDQRSITQAFLTDVTKLVDNGAKPDLIIFSGDLIDEGDDDEYFEFFDLFVQPLLQVTKCSENRLILVPGNHDARRSEIKQQSELQSKFCNPNLTTGQLNEFYRSAEFSDFVEKKFSGFHNLSAVLRGPKCLHTNPLAQVLEIEGTGIDIVAINTAWATSAGLNNSQSDQGRLIFPEAALIDAVEAGQAANKKILVGHHPTHWFHEKSCQLIETYTEGKCLAHLYGHMHDPQPKSVTGLRGKVIWNQSGSLHHRNDRFIGYALMSLHAESNRARFIFRQYSPLSREFTKAEQLIDGGTFYSDTAGAEFWRYQHNLIDRSKLRSWLQDRMRPLAEKDLNAGIAARELSQIFVYPKFKSASVSEDKGDLEKQIPPDTLVQFDELVSSSENFVIHGQQEHGKTAILNQLCLKIIESGNRIPAIIAFSDIRAGKNRILGAIKAAIPCEPDDFSIEQCLVEGLVTVCVDDVDFSNKSTLSRLRAFVNEYSKSRFIFTTLKGTIRLTYHG